MFRALEGGGSAVTASLHFYVVADVHVEIKRPVTLSSEKELGFTEHYWLQHNFWPDINTTVAENFIIGAISSCS